MRIIGIKLTPASERPGRPRSGPEFPRRAAKRDRVEAESRNPRRVPSPTPPPRIPLRSRTPLLDPSDS